MNQNLLRCFIIPVIFFLYAGDLFSQILPRTFIIDPRVISNVRNEAQKENNEYISALKALRKDADKALKLGVASVMDKKQSPPSGDKHDYMSLARYWWPNPTKKDGLPYMRRDGEVNPEIKDFSDHENFNRMVGSVMTLSLAYYYFGEKDYAEQAVKLLRAWFIDTTTRMNPNMNYAQAVPGRNDGRGSGILDAAPFYKLIDALGLLGECPRWPEQDRKAINEWFQKYLKWLQDSKNGKQEANAPNNHGTWYDVQTVSIALFIGNETLAYEILSQSREKRIAVQIEPNGTQPKELERTRSLSYSLYNLNALINLAALGERTDVDLWHFETKDGRSIRKALDYLLPYINGDKEWDRKQIAEVKMSDLYPLLLQAAKAYNEKKYYEAALKIPGASEIALRTSLIMGIANF